MQNSPAVSIIVPVFNASASLQRCIDSILAQSFPDFLLILVDDGSTDDSGRICEENGNRDNRIRTIHKKNGGVSSARNEGLDAVESKYVCFVDSDDYVETSWLETMISMCSYGSGYLPVCQVIQHTRGGRSLLYNFGNGCHTFDNLYRQEGWGYSWNKLFLTDRIKRFGLRFDESLKVYEDELFVASYTATGSCGFVFSDKPSYNYILPDFFNEKYSEVCVIDKLFYQYREMRKNNPEASNYVVDRLVMATLTSYKKTHDKGVITTLCDTVGKSIRHVNGAKKKPLRILALFPFHAIWIMAFKLYSRINL